MSRPEPNRSSALCESQPPVRRLVERAGDARLEPETVLRLIEEMKADGEISDAWFDGEIVTFVVLDDAS
jgi:hypothetical protein